MIRLKKYLKVLGIWLILTPIGILNGGLRIYITEPLLGSVALPLSSIILSVLIFIIIYLLIPKIGKCKTIEYIIIGVCFAVLTNVFDLIVTMIEKRPISDFFEMYNIATGNLWIIVVITMAFAPITVAKIRNEKL